MSPARALLAALVLAPAAARAHDLWIERDAGGLAVRLGHGRDATPVDPAKLSVRCVAGGATRELAAAAVVKERCDVLAATYRHGFFSLTPDGERPLPRTRVPDAVRSWEARAFAKWLDLRSPSAAAPLRDELEVVPGADAAAAGVGDKVTFVVLAAGKPLAGAVVTHGHRIVGETDSDGEIRVRLREPGAQVVGATLRRKVDLPEAESLTLEATIAFEVGE